MEEKYLTTENYGRFGNQLYYIMQAFILSKKRNQKIRYIPSPKTDQYHYEDFYKKLNLMDYVAYDFSKIENAEYLKNDKAYQGFGSDFKESDLYSFIENTILSSEEIKNAGNNIDFENSVGIHIRNGDYLTIPRYSFFDRKLYFSTVFEKKKSFKDKIAYVYSDDNKLNVEKYSEIFLKNFKNVVFVDSTSMIDDFLQLAKFKNKIVLNSTFAFWTAFVSNVLYKDSFKDIVAPNVFISRKKLKVTNRMNPKWTLIDVLNMKKKKR